VFYIHLYTPATGLAGAIPIILRIKLCYAMMCNTVGCRWCFLAHWEQFSFFLVNSGRRSSICRVPMEKRVRNPNDLSWSVGVPHYCILWPHSEKCHQIEDGVRHFNSVAPTWFQCWLWFVLRPCDNSLNCPPRRRHRVMFVKAGAKVSSWKRRNS
jgi:hypothetical protein